MSTILVVDDMAVFREPIAASLRAQGYETVCAVNGRDAMEKLRSAKPDLILLDVAMPVMDGISFLRMMHDQPDVASKPVILLTAVAERDYVVKAAEFGVRDYLLKSQFSLDELVHRIEQRLNPARTPDSPSSGGGSEDAAPAAGNAQGDGSTPAPSDPDAAPDVVSDSASKAVETLGTMKSLLKKSDVMDRLDSAGELKAFSPTVAKLLKLTRSESSSVDQISRALKQDHALSLKILKMANSAVYTRGDPVESVDKAVMRIGLTQIRQALLNIGVIDELGKVSLGGAADAGQFWEHSIACGLIAAELAHTRSAEEADLAFTMGLMHDVGRVMYVQEFADEYERVLQVANELQLPLEQVEKRLFTLSHADCMDRLLHAWKFPKELIDPIVFHHLSLGNIRRMAPRRITEVATLALANRFCHALGIGNSGNQTIYPTVEFFQVLKIEPKLVAKIEQDVREQTSNLKLALLTHSSGEAWPDMLQQCRDQLDAPVRPLFVGDNADYDAYRIFCDQLREIGDEPPNVAVVHLTDSRACVRLTSELQEAEREAGAEALPVIALSPNGQLALENRVMAKRPHRLLATPIPVRRLIAALNQLLASNQAQAA